MDAKYKELGLVRKPEKAKVTAQCGSTCVHG